MKHLKSVAFMFAITLVFAFMVSGVKELNEQRIELNQDLKLRRIILQVLNIAIPKAASGDEVLALFDKRVKTLSHEGKTVYVSYGPDGSKVEGYAFPVGGQGFWGPIEGMVAVDPKAEKLTGIAFYKHSETPGLGARITEKWFRNQFVGLKLQPVSGDKNIFYLKPSGSGQNPNELDAITGATRTSAAVEQFLNKELKDFLTKLWGSLRKS
jgi:Na+-transporting NADH:ubiquinone oxidoreductase subunit C